MRRNQKLTWERRGHTRKCASGKIVYVRPTNCHRHDEDEITETRPANPCRHSDELKIAALLKQNAATAEGRTLTLANGRYSVKCVVRITTGGLGTKHHEIHVTPPAYESGAVNAKLNNKAGYDRDLERHVVETCLKFITAAVSRYKHNPIASELGFESFKARTYVQHVADKSYRHVVIRDVDVKFASNEENAGVSCAYRTKHGRKTGERVPIWACEFARNVINLARDLIILHENETRNGIE